MEKSSNSCNVNIQIVSSKVINQYGTTQLRCLQLAEYLRTNGYKVEVEHIYNANPIKGGIIFAHRVIFDKYTEAFISFAIARGNIIIYDADDLIYRVNNKIRTNAGLKDFNKYSILRGKAMLKCDVVTVSTEYLANKAREFHKDVRVVRNALSKDISILTQRVYEEKKSLESKTISIGYFSGSQAHDRDFVLVEKTLLRLLRERDDVKVILAGKLTFSKEFYSFGQKFIWHEFLPYSQFIGLYRDIDINLIPLEVEDEFCQGKSELKYIEAGACGVVSVASATDTYKCVIITGENGILIKHNEWYEELIKLINSPKFRKKLGERAHRNVIEKYLADNRAKETDELLKDISIKFQGRFMSKKPSFDIIIISKLAVMRTLLKNKKVVRNILRRLK